MSVEHQAGGHAGGFKEGAPGQILKKVGKTEFAFYRDLPTLYPEWVPFVPTCFGTTEDESAKYVIMADLTTGMKKPSILDVKIGKTSIGEDAAPAKAASMREKDLKSTSDALGFRLTATRVYNNTTGEYLKRSNLYGRENVNVSNVVDHLREYFDDGLGIRREVVEAAIEFSKKVAALADSQRKIRVYSSSVLIVYDGDRSSDVAPRAHLIDFAHVHPIEDGGLDENYRIGIHSLIDYFGRV